MRILTVFLLIVYFGAAGQQAEPILFTEKTFDFGEIVEEAGHADHDFLFTNNSGRAIKILAVQASCGCTTPGWTKDPVQPGKTGFVKASFDPKGRPGYFNKSLTITTDFDANPITLQIKGQVINKKPEVDLIDYPATNGNLRFKANSFNLGKIYINRASPAKEFQVYNSSDKPVNFVGQTAGPSYIIVQTPQTLNPKEKGLIRLLLDAKARNQYGFISDNIELATDDEKQPVKSFSVYATVEEFFSPVSAAELAKAPVMQIDIPAIDLGRIRPGNILEREISFRNQGKKELSIRAVQGNCTCIGASADPVKIRPGGSGAIRISLNSQGRSGLQQKAVTVYSNDPKNPVQRIMITGYIDN